MKTITPKTIKEKLKKVFDPELNISIVDMGLIYDIKIKDDKVKIIMTLTTFGCPLYHLIEKDIKEKLKNLGLKEENIIIELTFDPPWSMEKMSHKAKKNLGFL